MSERPRFDLSFAMLQNVAKIKDLSSITRKEAKEKAEAELPAPLPVLREMFGWLEKKLDATPCDHTYRWTLEYARINELDEETLVEWVNNYGGECDCEVLAQVENSNPLLKG